MQANTSPAHLALIRSDQSFSDFYRAHVRRVHRRLLLLTGPGAHLDDLVQQTFLEFHSSLQSFRGECQLTTWLARITVNVGLQHKRRNRRKPPPEFQIEMLECEPATPATQDQAVELRRAFDLISALPDRLRVPLMLREVEGMTLSEIATTTGSSISTVSSRVERARKRILRDLRRRRQT